MNKIHFLTGLLLTPLLVIASPPTDFEGLVDRIAEIIGAFIPVIIGLILAVILWQVTVMFILRPDDEQARRTGRSIIILGTIGMVVVIGIWTIVGFLRRGIFGT